MAILNTDLTPEDEKLLRESLEAWKEETLIHLEEAANAKLEAKLEELEVAATEYREHLKEEFADKLVNALGEMRDEIRSEVIAETVRSNPEIKILEQIKELVAPTLNEEYFQGVYAQELVSLKEENDQLKEKMALQEGAQKLAELLNGYDSRTQKVVLSLIKAGDAESITEQFYDILESLEGLNEEDDEEEASDEEETDEEDAESEDEKPTKPKKADFEDEDEFDDAMKQYEKDLKAWEKSQEETDEEDDEEESDEEDMKESTVNKGVLGLDEEFDEGSKRNILKEQIAGLSRSKR